MLMIMVSDILVAAKCLKKLIFYIFNAVEKGEILFYGMII